jgi:hypothetical protein
MLRHCENVKGNASFHYFSDVKDHTVLSLIIKKLCTVWYILVSVRYFPENPSAKFYNLFRETFLSKKKR